jgi:hypothetical protein
MRKAYLIGTIIGVAGVYLLYRGNGDAQLRDVPFSHRAIELVAGMVLAMVGYIVYTYARTLSKQPRPEDLSIITKARTEKR